MRDLTLTEALAELGYSHHQASAELRRVYGVLCGRVIVDDETGEPVGIMHVDDAWEFVHARRRERGTVSQTELVL